jgi:hypothetical protein
MTTPATTEADTDPVRAAILTAIERLVDGTPQRSEGRLSVPSSRSKQTSNAGASPTSTPTSKTSSKHAPSSPAPAWLPRPARRAPRRS